MKLLFFLLAFSLQYLRADVTAGEMLMSAAIHGDLNTMESLLSAGFNPNLPLRGGVTPIFFALQLPNPGALELLLAWQGPASWMTPSRADRSIRRRSCWRMALG